jgi:hypothetical protein
LSGCAAERVGAQLPFLQPVTDAAGPAAQGCSAPLHWTAAPPAPARPHAAQVGGPEDAVAAAQPLLAAMGRSVVHLGGVGMGQAAKLCNNLCLGESARAP